MVDSKPLPRLRSDLKISQVDAFTFDLIHPISGATLRLDGTGYMVAEQFETGDKTLDQVVDELERVHGLKITSRQLSDFLRKAASLDLLDSSLHLVAENAEDTAGNQEVLQFAPSARLSAEDEVQRLADRLGSAGAMFLRVRKRTWWLIAVSIVVFICPWKFRVGGPIVIEPTKRLLVRAPVTGRVEELFCKEGEFIKEGLPVFRMSGFLPEIERKRAEIAKLEAELLQLRRGATSKELFQAAKKVETSRKVSDQARRSYERQMELFGKGLVSEDAVEKARAENEIHQKQLEEVEAQYELLKGGTRPEVIRAKEAEQKIALLDLDTLTRFERQSVVSASISGIVSTSELYQLLGKQFQVGETVIELADPKSVTVKMRISEKDIAAVREGAGLHFRVQAIPSVTMETKVRRLSPVAEADPNDTSRTPTKYFRVYAEMENPGRRLLSGMTGYGLVDAPGIYGGNWHMLGLIFFRHAIRSMRVNYVF